MIPHQTNIQLLIFTPNYILGQVNVPQNLLMFSYDKNTLHKNKNKNKNNIYILKKQSKSQRGSLISYELRLMKQRSLVRIFPPFSLCENVKKKKKKTLE